MSNELQAKAIVYFVMTKEYFEQGVSAKQQYCPSILAW
jgi:hypothetical protein